MEHGVEAPDEVQRDRLIRTGDNNAESVSKPAAFSAAHAVRAIVLVVAVATLSSGCGPKAPPAMQWIKTYSGRRGHSNGQDVRQTRDGGYVAVGADMNNQTHFYLVKTDSLGRVEWDSTFQATDLAVAHAVIQTNDGGYAVAGGVDHDACLLRLDPSGKPIWQRLFADPSTPSGVSLLQTRDGGFALLCGHLMARDSGLGLIETDSLGKRLWDQWYAIPRDDYPMFIPTQLLQTTDGGYIIAARSLLKIDSAGNVQWQKTYPEVNYTYAVVQTPDGGYVAGADVDRPGLFLLRTDRLGNMLWLRGCLTRYLTGYGLEQLPGRGYVITCDLGPAVRGYVVRTDTAGKLVWCDSLDVILNARGVTRTKDGGLMVTGTYCDSVTGNSPLFLLKYAPER